MKGSPFKLKSPLYNHEPGHVDALGTINPTSIGMAKNTVGQNKSVITSPSTGEVLSGVDGDTSIETTSPQDNVNNLLTKIDDADKAYGTAFENDGRSSGQFEKRINKATDEGKLGRAQRLKNRKAGFMQSQANKVRKQGGKLTSEQSTALVDATSQAKGTGVGNFLRKKVGNKMPMYKSENNGKPFGRKLASQNLSSGIVQSSSYNDPLAKDNVTQVKRSLAGTHRADGSINPNRKK